MTTPIRKNGALVRDLAQALGQMTPNQLDRALREHPFTRGLSDNHLAKLAACGQIVSLAEDEVVFRAHQPSSHFYLLLTGSVCVEVRTPVHAICVQSVHPGEAFGWSSLLPSHQTMFQVRAHEESAAICLDGQQLSAACEQDPSLGYEVLRRLLDVVFRRLQATERRLAEFWGVRAATDQIRRPCE